MHSLRNLIARIPRPHGGYRGRPFASSLSGRLWGALFLLCLSAPASAQVNYKAMEKAFGMILRKYPLYADSVAKRMVEKYRRQPEVYAGVARAYFFAGGEDKADDYLARCLHVDTLYAPAYVLRGDMALSRRDTLEAARWFRTAATVKPREPEGYLRYVELMATRDMQASLAVLDSMKHHCPGYPVGLLQASVFYFGGQFDRAIALYKEAPADKMTDGDYLKYAASHYFSQQYQQGLDVANEGLARYDQSVPLYRMKFYNLAELKDYKGSLAAGTYLLKRYEATKGASYRDVMYYGVVNNRAGNRYTAIDVFASVLNNDSTYCTELTQADLDDASQKVRDIMTEVKASGDYDEAAKLYSYYLSKRRRVSAYDDYQAARIYMDKLEHALEVHEGVDEAYGEFDTAFSQLEQKHADWDQMDLIYYYHGVYATNVRDTLAANGAALPYYTRMIAIVEGKQLTDRERSMLKTAYTYMAYYYNSQNDQAEARKYFRRLLVVDPENAAARRYLG